MKNQVIMWFSGKILIIKKDDGLKKILQSKNKFIIGMRGAVAFALALHMELNSEEAKRVVLTTTLFIVLFTIVFMGGSALPMIKVFIV